MGLCQMLNSPRENLELAMRAKMGATSCWKRQAEFLAQNQHRRPTTALFGESYVNKYSRRAFPHTKSINFVTNHIFSGNLPNNHPVSLVRKIQSVVAVAVGKQLPGDSMTSKFLLTSFLDVFPRCSWELFPRFRANTCPRCALQIFLGLFWSQKREWWVMVVSLRIMKEPTSGIRCVTSISFPVLIEYLRNKQDFSKQPASVFATFPW